MILAALLLSTAPPIDFAPDADWQLVFSDEPQGSVFYNADGIVRDGPRRRLTIKFDYTIPRPNGTSFLYSDLEIDCPTAKYRIKRAVALDLEGEQLYDYQYSLAENPFRQTKGQPFFRVMKKACTS
jgi:hypothetical protein